MAKNIALSEEAYQILLKMKLTNESFSDTIRRLATGAKLMEIAGSKTVTKKEWLKVEEAFSAQGVLDRKRRASLLGKPE